MYIQNDVSDIPDLTFSMDADEEKHILYEKNEVNVFGLSHLACVHENKKLHFLGKSLLKLMS